MILDEATANIDSETESLIQNSLEKNDGSQYHVSCWHTDSRQFNMQIKLL